MPVVSFKATKQERLLIDQIVARAMREKLNNEDALSLHMDITAAHANGNKLDLSKLLSFDDFNFAHDVCGIQCHIDRDTGKMMHCFRPRASDPGKPLVRK